MSMKPRRQLEKRTHIPRQESLDTMITALAIGGVVFWAIGFLLGLLIGRYI